MLDDFDIGHCNDYDDNSNTSDKSFEFDNDKEFEAELVNENILGNEHGIGDNDKEESNVDLVADENQEVGDQGKKGAYS